MGGWYNEGSVRLFGSELLRRSRAQARVQESGEWRGRIAAWHPRGVDCERGRLRRREFRRGCLTRGRIFCGCGHNPWVRGKRESGWPPRQLIGVGSWQSVIRYQWLNWLKVEG